MHLLQLQLISHVREATCYTTARISGVYYMVGRINPPLGYEFERLHWVKRCACFLSLQLRQKTLNQGEDSKLATRDNHAKCGWIQKMVCCLAFSWGEEHLIKPPEKCKAIKSSRTKVGFNGAIVSVVGVQRRWPQENH